MATHRFLNQRQSNLLALTYLVSLSLTLYFFLRTWAYDDPFITYRYAQNLARGLGFVYNPGEPILSTTTPLWTLLLVIPASLNIELPRFANLLSAISLALGGLALWSIARQWKTPWVGWAGLALYPTFGLVCQTIGSETPLYLALCLATLAFYTQKRYLLAAGCAALAILARPDGFLIPVSLVIHFVFTYRSLQSEIRWPKIWVGVGIFSAILLAWIIFAWLYFGSPLPVTLAAKQSQGMMSISQHFAPGLFTILKGYNRWFYWLQAGLACVGLLAIARPQRPGLLIFGWTFLYFGAYALLGVTRYFWYYAPLVPGWIVLVGLGLQWLVDTISKRIPIKNWLIPTSILICLAGAQIWGIHQLSQQPDPRYTIYRAIGEWLARNTAPGESVGVLEVGIIGYYAQRPMIDFAGLIQPEVARQMTSQTTYQDTALWAVQRYQPSYVILHPGDFTTLEDNLAQHGCQITQSFLGNEYGYKNNLIIYNCPKNP